MSAVLTAAFLISLAGYYLGYSLYVKRANAFFPLIFVSFTVTVLYIFGLAGILWAGLYAVLLAGIALIPLLLIRRKKDIPAALKGAVSDLLPVYIIAGTVWVFCITRGVGLSHSDDFSHWYRICKIMHYDGGLPVTRDLSFTTYMPGMALWIWFITSITGFAPDRCLFAQSLINLAALASFFSLGRKENKGISGKIGILLITCLMSVVLCSMDVNTYCLPPDTTLALIPMAAVFFILDSRKDESRTDLIMLILIMVLEVFTKVPGILFAFFICVFRLRRSDLKGTGRKKALLKGFLPFIIPMVLFYSYIIRANIVYGDIDLSDQGFSLTRFIAMFMLKTGDQIKAIAGRFLYELFAFTGDMSMQVRVLWLLFAVMAVILVVMFKKKDIGYKELKKAVLELFVLFISYSIFLLMVYLFSMYDNEADGDHLNCFYRYIGSVTVFVCGVIAYCLFGIFNRKENKWKILGPLLTSAVLAAVAVLMFDIGYIAGADYYRPAEEYTTNAWDLCNEYAQERTTYNEESYFLVYDENDIIDSYPFKIKLIGIVYFRSNNVYAYMLTDLEHGNVMPEDLQAIRNCDHLVTMGDMSDHADLIREYVDFGDYRPGMIDLKGV